MALPAVLALTGCTPSQVVQAVEGFLTEAAALLKAAGQTTWAANLQTAANDVQIAFNVWQAGPTSTTAQKVEAALNAAVAVTAAILPNDPFAQLIDELVAVATLAINLLGPNTALAAHAMGAPNPHVGAVPLPVDAKAALDRWNTKASSRP